MLEKIGRFIEVVENICSWVFVAGILGLGLWAAIAGGYLLFTRGYILG